MAVCAAWSCIADFLPPPLLIGHTAWVCVGGMPPAIVAIAMVGHFILIALKW